MSYLLDAAVLLIEVFFGLAAGLFLFRVALQLVGASFHNPISQFFYRTTNPVLMPLRRWLPAWRRLDLAGLAIAFVVQLLKVVVLALLLARLPAFVGWLVLGLAELLALVLGIALWLVVIRAVLSFVGADRSHPALPLLAQLTEPLLRPVRRLLPATGAFDFAPLLVILALVLARLLLLAPLLDLGRYLAFASG
jgi:YggT family protein